MGNGERGAGPLDDDDDDRNADMEYNNYEKWQFYFNKKKISSITTAQSAA